MDVPGQNHREPWFNHMFKDLLKEIKFIFDTQNGQTFIFSGTGTGGWEVALSNTLSPGDKVVAYRYGLFSHLWVDMMRRLGLDVEIIDERWGDGAHEDRLEKVLKNDIHKKVIIFFVINFMKLNLSNLIRLKLCVLCIMKQRQVLQVILEI